MGWNLTDDVEEYLARVHTFLSRDPAENTVLLSVSESLRVHGADLYGDIPASFGWWANGGDIGGVFLITSPHPVLLGDMPESAARELAGILADRGTGLPGVNAGQATATAFADEWHRRTGAVAEIQMRQRLYRLGRLDERDSPPGVGRIAVGSDFELVLAWYRAFARESGDPAGPPPAVVEDKIGFGGVALWEVDGVPVSMAGRTRILAGMARVAPVYTPVEHRRHGYGTAVTATVTRSVVEAGAAEVVLFTDLANPTSNSIYRRLGYLAVNDRLVISFAD